MALIFDPFTLFLGEGVKGSGLFHCQMSLSGFENSTCVQKKSDFVLGCNQTAWVYPKSFLYGVLGLRNAFEMREQVIALEFTGMMLPRRVADCLAMKFQALVILLIVACNPALNMINVGPEEVFG